MAFSVLISDSSLCYTFSTSICVSVQMTTFLHFVPVRFHPKLTFLKLLLIFFFFLLYFVFLFLKMKLIKCVNAKYLISAPLAQFCNSHFLICTDVGLIVKTNVFYWPLVISLIWMHPQSVCIWYVTTVARPLDGGISPKTAAHCYKNGLTVFLVCHVKELPWQWQLKNNTAKE